jgi:hypothetical protein
MAQETISGSVMGVMSKSCYEDLDFAFFTKTLSSFFFYIHDFFG